MGRYTSGGIGRDVLAGAVAGGAAVWLISKMDWSLHHAGKAVAGQSAVADPAHKAAARAADAAGVKISDQQKNVAAHTVHYGVGIGIGALYGLLRGMAPSVTTGRGSLFGMATFILGDEIGAPALGLAKGPLEYAARDHAKSALSHIVFGIFTDLGTRLLSPWKSEVVIMRGPTIHERVEEGRQSLADGRDYLQDQGQYVLDQGRSYLQRGREVASEYADQALEQIDELDLPRRAKQGRKTVRRFAETLRSHLPDADDLSDLVDEGRKRVRGVARDVSSRLPDRDDLDDAVQSGRKQARGWARAAAKRMPDQDDLDDLVETGRSRARSWWRSAADALPDRDDVSDAVDSGRKQGRAYAKRARAQMPDRDDVRDAVNDGRKRVRGLADDARDSGSSLLGRVSSWLFG